MHALAQAELPAMVIVVGLPIDGERRAYQTIRIERGQSIQNQPPREAIRAMPRIAGDLYAQRAAVVGPRPSPRTDPNQNQKKNQKKTNCKVP